MQLINHSFDFIAGVDYEPVNQKITIDPADPVGRVTIRTIDDEGFEADEGICLNLTNAEEPCPNTIEFGDPIRINIQNNDRELYSNYILLYPPSSF